MHMDRLIASAIAVAPSWSEGTIEAVPAGTRVLTLQGMQPVDTLAPGDHVITRAGARRLRALAIGDGGYHLSFDRPAIVLTEAGQRRARAQ